MVTFGTLKQKNPETSKVSQRGRGDSDKWQNGKYSVRGNYFIYTHTIYAKKVHTSTYIYDDDDV